MWDHHWRICFRSLDLFVPAIRFAFCYCFSFLTWKILFADGGMFQEKFSGTGDPMIYYNVMVPRTFLGLKSLSFTFPFTNGVDYGKSKAGNRTIQYWDQIRGSGRYGATHFWMTSNTLWLNLKIIEEDKHVGLEYPGDEALCLWLRAVTYDVSDWIAAVRSPRVISVSLNSATLGQCLVINLTVCQLELNRKQKWANVF